MKSTGEVLGIGKTREEALYKGLVAAGYNMKRRGGLLVTVRDSDKEEITDAVRKFYNLGFKLYATKGTADELSGAGMEVTIVGKLHESSDNILTLIESGNPDQVEIGQIGPMLEHAPIFPDRANIEFVHVINPHTLKMRVWERGSGETLACGTGACAAVVAATENGFCPKGEDITVRLRGGDLLVRYTDEGVFMTGDARKNFEGQVEL